MSLRDRFYPGQCVKHKFSGEHGVVLEVGNGRVVVVWDSDGQLPAPESPSNLIRVDEYEEM